MSTQNDSYSQNLSNIYPDFDEIEISTKTVIIKTNCLFHLKFLFENLPISNYTIVPKKRGRKKEIVIEDPNKNLEEGSIITIKFADSIKGANLKKSKKNENKKFFRNALSIVMKIDNKFINFKLPSKGKIQMTGIKTNDQAIKCMKYLFKYINKFDKNDCYTLTNPENTNIEIITNIVMTNIDFKLGFLINRQNLHNLFNRLDDTMSIFEPSYGYTGVNIKSSIEIDKDRELESYTYDTKNKNWTTNKITYSEYLDKLPETEKNKELNKKRYNSFMVFHSGSCIMSSINKDHNMKKSYCDFIKNIDKNRNELVEKLD